MRSQQVPKVLCIEASTTSGGLTWLTGMRFCVYDVMCVRVLDVCS